MAVTLSYSADLVPFAPSLDEVKAAIMIRDAIALAARVAPCILGDDLDEDAEDAAKAIIRGAILRWNDQGSGEQAALTAGVFGFTPSRNQRRFTYYPNEITDLARICRAGDTGSGRKAYMVDMIPPLEEG